MPFHSSAPLLNRDNAVCQLLESFRSNSVVKGLVILPGVSDDFYLVNRDQPKLDLRATNLLEAITQLTNTTALRVRFQAPFLLLYTSADTLDPMTKIDDPAHANRLKMTHRVPPTRYCDTHWDQLQPNLEKALGISVAPPPRSTAAWHFDRHNFAGWGLSDWEVLEAVALSAKTRFIVQRRAVQFDLGDQRSKR